MPLNVFLHLQLLLHTLSMLYLNLLGILDDALASTPWFSGEEFGLGDIALAPFIYSLFNVHSAWTPRPNLTRWYQQLCERPTVQSVVMIPVT